MNILPRTIITALAAAAVLLTSATAQTTDFAKETPPVKIIFDTDMGNDVDDALALALIHSLQTRGACELLAVTHTIGDPLAGRYSAAVNEFYGRPSIPIGVTPDARVGNSRFLKVALNKDAKGNLLYPTKYDAAKAPQSVALLRRVLAAAADQEIVMIQVGFSTNLARLLETGPDDISPLSGKELIQKKIKFLSIMAGKFPYDDGKNPEFNVRWDIPAARKLVATWPTPIIWSGWEIGVAVCYPAWSIDKDFAYVKNHPVQEAYQAYRATPHERPCWDLTSVIAAVWPERDYYSLSPAGKVTMGEDGRTVFSAAEGGRDYYMIVSPAQAARMREALAMLSSEPPKKPCTKR